MLESIGGGVREMAKASNVVTAEIVSAAGRHSHQITLALYVQVPLARRLPSEASTRGGAVVALASPKHVMKCDKISAL